MKCRLYVEINGNSRLLKLFNDDQKTQPLVDMLNEYGIPAMLSCFCGLHGVGNCESCNADHAEEEDAHAAL